MDINKILNDDCAVVANKFMGQIIRPMDLQNVFGWGYNRAGRTIEGLIVKGMAIKAGPGPYACKVNANAEYLSRRLAKIDKQLALLSSKNQVKPEVTLDDLEKESVKKLAAHDAEVAAKAVEALKFPIMLRKMWSAGEVQDWLKEEARLLRQQAKAGE